MAGKHKAEPETVLRLVQQIAPYEWGGWLLLPQFIDEDVRKARGVKRLAELAALQTRSR